MFSCTPSVPLSQLLILAISCVASASDQPHLLLAARLVNECDLVFA